MGADDGGGIADLNCFDDGFGQLCFQVFKPLAGAIAAGDDVATRALLETVRPTVWVGGWALCCFAFGRCLQLGRGGGAFSFRTPSIGRKHSLCTVGALLTTTLSPSICVWDNAVGSSDPL